MTKQATHMSAGRDYNHPLHGRYEYVLFAADETIVARQSGFKSKAQAVRAGYKAGAAGATEPAKPDASYVCEGLGETQDFCPSDNG